MEFNISINLDNAAFDGLHQRSLEIEALLEHVAEQVRYGYQSRAIIDSNGNKVGSWSITGGE